MDSSSNLGGESEDDLSEWESFGRAGKKSSKGRPAAKRAKLFAEAGSLTATGRRTRKCDLNLFLTMPIDVIYEVFGLLAPKDLISLTRTSKMIRKTLTSPNFVTVWKSVREWKAPAPPQDYSEPRWAAFLYGGSKIAALQTYIRLISLWVVVCASRARRITMSSLPKFRSFPRPREKTTGAHIY